MTSEMLEIVGPALIAGLMIALTHAPLGIEVLRRGIIFIDLSIAQIAGLGMVVAHSLWQEPLWWQVQGVALIFALVAALCFRLIERILPKEQEAIIGCSFVSAASLALLLLAEHSHGDEEIQHLLSGQILFVTWSEIIKHAPIYLTILTLWFTMPKLRYNAGFYLLFALAITSSVQLVGIYVVFASLILPALAASRSLHPHVVAWSCGVSAVSVGIFIAIIADAPGGPIIVLSYAVLAMLCRLWQKTLSFYHKA